MSEMANRILTDFPTIFLHEDGTYLQLFFVVYTQAICLWWLETYSFNDFKEEGAKYWTRAAPETDKIVQ